MAREYKSRGLPLSVIVIDFFHWTKMGDWKFDPECWPDPKAMAQELGDMGCGSWSPSGPPSIPTARTSMRCWNEVCSFEQMRVAHETGLPPMHPLFFDFPDDEICWSVEDQFFLGPDILVAPVLFSGARSREVYIPEGTDCHSKGTKWVCAWTEERPGGGQWITADAPLERIPVYVRAGKKIPLRKR